MTHRAEEMFSKEERELVAGLPMTDDVLFATARASTRGLWEFGDTVMFPVFAGQLNLSELETAIGFSFYRLLCALRTLCDLSHAYQFQTMAGCARTVLELCVDIQLLCGPNAIERAAEKFHGFTRAARFRAAYERVKYFDAHPQLDSKHETEEHRALLAKANVAAEIADLCRDLWNRPHAPQQHWSNLPWTEQVKLAGESAEAAFVKWKGFFAGMVHGGASSVAGLESHHFWAVEIISRDTVKKVVPDAYRTVAAVMHMPAAIPTFYEEFHRMTQELEVCAAIDTKLVALGRTSKLDAIKQPAKGW